MYPLKARQPGITLKFVLKFLLLCLLYLSVSCQTTLEESTAVFSRTPEPVQELETIPVYTATRPPPLTVTPAATLTPVPTATPNPIAAVYAPSNWSTKLKRSIDSLNDSSSEFFWQITLDEASADLIISPVPGEYPAGSRPLVLTVPITSDWDQLSLDEAKAILSTGHSVIEVHDIAELAPNIKFIKIDGIGPFDPNYPLLQNWSVFHGDGAEKAAEELSTLLLQNPLPDPLVHLAAVGDIMLDRSLGAAIRNGSIDYPFEYVKDELLSADLTIGNLESAIGDTGEPANKSYTFQAPPEAGASLANAGFDLLSLANNHALDFGQDALLQGISLLQDAGIHAVGAGADAKEARSPIIIESKGVRFAFLSYVNVPVEGSGFDTKSWAAGPSSPGLNWADQTNIVDDVQNASETSDIVIVLLHSGYEYVEQPSPAQSAAAKQAIDAGADLVIGHHAHVLQGIEFYNGGVIVYGLGNFAFEIDGDPSTGILNVWLDKDGVRQLNLVPAVIQFGGQPRLAAPGEAALIRKKVNILSDLLNRR